MKTLRYLFRLSLILCFCGVSVVAAQTIHQVAAGTDVLKAAIDAAAAGDIIELTSDGGQYLSGDQIVLDKDLTIRGQEGLADRPVLKYVGTSTGAYMFKVVGSPRIEITNLEFNGDGTAEGAAAKAKYALRLDNGDSTGTMQIVVDNCVMHDFNEKIIKPYANCGIDSLLVHNSMFYNGAKEGIVLYTGSSSDPAVHIKYAEFRNCTFSGFAREGIKGDTNPDIVLRVDHCTFYDCGGSSKALLFVDDLKDVEVKNSIFAMNTYGSYAIRLESDDNAFHHNVIWDVASWKVSNSANVSDTLHADPMFTDAANLDFTLDMTSPAIGFADDAKAAGDLRWDPTAMKAAVHKVEAGTDVLKTVIDAAAAGDTIELVTSGGLYLSSDQIVLEKDVTIRGRAGLAQKPILKYVGTSTGAYMFKVIGSPRVEMVNLEFDGDGTAEGAAALAKYALRLDNADTSGTMQVLVDDCVMHDFNEKIIKPYANCGIDSLLVRNSMFYNGVKESIVLYSGSSSDPAVQMDYAEFVNCTFSGFAREGIKADTNPNIVMRVDHCTFYDCGGSSKPLLYVDDLKDVEIKNSIFASNTYGSYAVRLESDDNSFHHNVIWDVASWNVSNSATVSDTLHADPMFKDPANMDFTLGESSLARTAGEGGTPAGDLRWAINPNAFLLTVVTVGNGIVTMDPPGGVYDPGTTVTLTAIPDEGWKFTGWEGAAAFPPDNPVATVTMDADKTVKAFFETTVTKYTVEIASIGIGHVEANPEPSDKSQYDEGTEVTLTPVPDSTTWEFAYWVDANGDSLTNASPLVFTVTEDTSFTAMFRSTVEQVELNLTILGMGDVSVDPMPVPGFVTYDINTEITLVADPATGWQFDGYSGDVTEPTDSVTFTLDMDKSVTATFTEIPHPDGMLAIDSSWDLLEAVEYAHNNSQVTTIVLTDVGPYQPTEDQRDPSNGRMPPITLRSPLRIVADTSLTEKPVIRGYTSTNNSTSSEGFFRFRAGSGTLELENLIIDGYLNPEADTKPAKYIFRADDGGDTVFCSLKAENVDFSNTAEAFWKNYSNARVDSLIFNNCTISNIGKEGLYLKATGHVNYVEITNSTVTKVAREIIYLKGMADAVVNMDHVTIADCGFGAGSDPAKHGAVKIENTSNVQLRNLIIYKVLNTEYGYALRIAGENSLIDNVLFWESAEKISLKDDAQVGPDVFWYDPMFVDPDNGDYTLADSSVAYHLASDGTAAIGDLRWATGTNIPTYNALNLTIEGDGTVAANPAPMAKFYIPGTVVTLTATPDSGSYFVRWTGDVTGLDNPVQVTMDGDKQITATFSVRTDVAETAVIPTAYRLDQNYPNPFNPMTTIRFDLKQAGHTTLKVYDMLGREVMTLVDKQMEAGRYKVVFHIPNLASGVYFYKIESGDFVAFRKMILMK